MSEFIKVENLTKVYDVVKKEEGVKGSIKTLFKKSYICKTAVDHVSFEMDKGEFAGFIGPNGAGKTTTIKALTGIIHPSSGKVRILGFEPQKSQNEFKRKISVTMGQKNQLWWDIPAKDSFNLLRVIYKIPVDRYNKTLDELTDLFGVRELQETPLRNLSLGERMKMELISALLHDPEILFLDEPTIGLDVAARKSIREFLKYINEKKKTTIMLTSHYLEDIDYLCNRIIAINKGAIKYDGSIKSIRSKMVDQKIVSVSAFDICNFDKLKVFAEKFEIHNNTIQLHVRKDQMTELGRALFSNDMFYDVNIGEISLDETFEILFGKGKQQ